MDFKLTEEQELLLESVRGLVTRNFPESYWKECDENHKVPYEFMKAYSESGFSLLGIPEELGGTPTDLVTKVLMKIELGRLGVPLYAVALEDIILQTIYKYGTSEQIQRCVTSLKEGRQMMALAATEPQAGSDLNNITTSYSRRNGKVYLNGHKTFITNAKEADQMIVIARNPEATNPKMIFTGWFVSPKAPGVKVELLGKIGTNTIHTCEVYFDDVELEESDMFGTEGKGFIQLMEGFEEERLFSGVVVLGMAMAAFEDAARYANQREQFGQKIGGFQLVQEKLVNMKIKIENMYNMILKTAWLMDNGQSVRGKVEYLKLYCAKSACEVIDDALQVFGGIGYTNDHRISRFWRDSRVFRIGGGTDEIQILTAAKEILKQYK